MRITASNRHHPSCFDKNNFGITFLNIPSSVCRISGDGDCVHNPARRPQVSGQIPTGLSTYWDSIRFISI